MAFIHPSPYRLRCHPATVPFARHQRRKSTKRQNDHLGVYLNLSSLSKQGEIRRKESIWHDISVSAGFNPVRTADQFTDRIRAGFAVSMPLDILLFRNTSRVSREVEGLELQKMRGDLKRELRRLWYERQRRLIEIRQMEVELGLARLQVQKVSTLLIAQDASLDAVKEAEVAVSRIEAGITNKQIDVRDLEDGLLALVGKQ